MTIDQQRRTLIRHGFIFLIFAFLFGLATATLTNAPRWASAHLTALLTGPLLGVIGLVWRELRLTNRQRSIAFMGNLIAAYAGLVLNVYVSIVNMPGPASSPGVMATAQQNAVLTALLIVIIPTTAAAWGLMLFGMRGGTPPS